MILLMVCHWNSKFELMHTAHFNQGSAQSCLFLSFIRKTIGEGLEMNILLWFLLLGSIVPALGVARYPVQPGDWKKYYSFVQGGQALNDYSKIHAWTILDLIGSSTFVLDLFIEFHIGLMIRWDSESVIIMDPCTGILHVGLSDRALTIHMHVSP